MTTTQPDSMTKDEGLLPCPFCGVGAPAVWLYRDKPNHIIEPKWNAHCKVCNIVISARGKKEAITAWNRRPTPSSADNALRESLLVQARQMAERIAQWHPINDSLSVPGAEARTFLAALATSPPAPAQAAEVDERRDRVIMSSVRLGRWLSAALDDPNVCEEMKADIQDWFSAGEPVAGWNAAPVSPTPVEAGAPRPGRDVIAYSIIEGSAGIRAAEHAKEFQTVNWTDALRSADAVIACLAALSKPTPVEAEALDYATELRQIAGLLAQQPDGPVRWKQYRLAAVADYLAALPKPGSSESGGWLPIETAPHACHVLATYFDTLIGEWIFEFIPSPPSGPWTHFMFVQPPSTPSSKER